MSTNCGLEGVKVWLEDFVRKVVGEHMEKTQVVDAPKTRSATPKTRSATPKTRTKRSAACVGAEKDKLVRFVAGEYAIQRRRNYSRMDRQSIFKAAKKSNVLPKWNKKRFMNFITSRRGEIEQMATAMNARKYLSAV